MSLESCCTRSDLKLISGLSRAKRTEEWFELHDDVLARIQQLTRSATSENPRVKIAILDSGLELSADHRQCYDYEPKIQYWTGIDDDANERDDVGHGTHLAILLRKIAPRAAVHVARVFEKKPKSNESAEMIAKVRQTSYCQIGAELTLLGPSTRSGCVENRYRRHVIWFCEE